MKKLVTALALTAITAFASEEALFTGVWCVEDEGISLTFVDDTTVTFSSEDDETVGGSGTFSYDDSTLTASVDNDGMMMEVVYGYETIEEGLEIETISMTLDGTEMATGEDKMIMVRCNKSDEE